MTMTIFSLQHNKNKADNHCRRSVTTRLSLIVSFAFAAALLVIHRTYKVTSNQQLPVAPFNIRSNGNHDPKTVAFHQPQPLPFITDDSCCVPCTIPANTCCLACSATSSPREHDLLMATMEGVTHHIMDKYTPPNPILRESKWEKSFIHSRAWEGNSHIGNRDFQATYYYDWIRSLGNGVNHVCEIGMNGGHSAIIFLAGMAETPGSRVTMFDLNQFSYSHVAIKYVETLYPGKFTVIEGNSLTKVPEWKTENPNDKCDVFSVDGDHAYKGAKADIVNAASATKKGGYLLLDDMQAVATRQAFDEAVNEGVLKDPMCMENVPFKVGYVDRVNKTSARNMEMAWCSATVV